MSLSDERLHALARAKAELAVAGDTPERFKLLASLGRRLLWPFTRPYHFKAVEQLVNMERLLLERMAALDAQLAAPNAPVAPVGILWSHLLAHSTTIHELAARIDQNGSHLLAHSTTIHELAARIDQDRTEGVRAHSDELRPLLEAQARLRSELTAMVNRYDWLERELKAQAESLSASGGSVLRLALLDDRITGHQHLLEALIRDDHSSSARIAALEGKVEFVPEAQPALFLGTSQGAVFVLRTGDLISEAVRKTHEWDRHVVDAARRAAITVRARVDAPHRLVALDVGAHFGLISVALAEVYDTVISFEANPFNARLLRANAVLNGLADKIVIRREAVSDVPGRVSLAPEDEQEIPIPTDAHGLFAFEQTPNTGAYSFVHGGTGLLETEAVNLDGLDYEGISFVKVDVQGADGAVILGGLSMFERNRPWIVFEWEDLLCRKFKITFEEVTARLSMFGYTVSELHRHNEKQIDYLALPSSEASSAASSDG